MEKEVKFSVLIPAYKDTYLSEAIDSVLSQSYKLFELIIVNDASPFDIDSIIEQYEDSRIHYFKNDINCGAKDVVDNWNICLSKATGDYVVCIGDDDRLKPNCLMDFLYLIEKYPKLDVFHTGTEIIDENSFYMKTLEKRPEYESVYSLIYSINDSGLGSYLYRIDTLRRNGGFYKLPYGWSSDFITAFIAANKFGIANTPNPGFQYRGNGKSISHDISCIEDKIRANIEAKDWVLSFVSNKETNSDTDLWYKKVIPYVVNKRTINKIDELIEFDIRKELLNRFKFWLHHKSIYGITNKRLLKCLLKSIKYRFCHHF